MDNVTAELIGKKAKALKHCNKILDKIEKNGKVTIKLGNTGVEIEATRGDAMHLKFITHQARLTQEIKSYEIVQKAMAEQITIPLPSITAVKGNVVAENKA